MASFPHKETTTAYNRCNLPPWVIYGREFQENPQALELEGVRVTNRWLFKQLEATDDPVQRSRIFSDYVTIKFRLHEWAEHKGSARSSLRYSYVQFLHGWGADSNGHAGAVLKDWVESRFGLCAIYHGGQLKVDDAAIAKYWNDRMRGASKTMGAAMQLDLLYTYCQDELVRRYSGKRWITLYRGTHDPEEYAITRQADATVVQLNNLSSFTSDPEIAWEFGSLVWEVNIPVQKIIFFSGLLPPQLLGGESEFLVLGGEYKVKTMLY